MAEKSGKHDLCAGTSWSLFGENVLFEDSEDVDTSDDNDAETTRLHKEDMHQFGLCPARDALNLIVCKECQKVLYPVSLKRHYERRHPKLIPRVKSPPRRTLPPPKEIKSPVKQQPSYGKSKILKSPDNSFIRIEEVDPNDISVKIEEVPLTIPKFNHTAKAKLPKINLKGLTGVSGKAKLSPVSSKPLATILNPVKKGTGNKDKEYDPDRHCGVWMVEQSRNCTRSLTCKTHSLSLRRAVSGRSKSFDVLLAEHKAKVNSIKEAGVSPGGATPTPSPTKSASCGPPFPSGKLDSLGKAPSLQNTQVLRSPKATGSLVASTLESKYSVAIGGHHTENGNSVDFLPDESIGSSNLPTIPYHPRPLKVNTFGSYMRRRGGCVSFNRQMSHFRCATKAMLERFSNPVLRSTASNAQDASECLKIPSASRSEGMCTIQVVDQGRQSTGNFKSSGMNLPSSSDPSQLGPVPRVKTKKLHAGMKRQMSADVQPGETPTLQTPSKRRHSIEANPSALSSVSPNIIETNGQNGIKHLKELGHVVANIDSVPSYEIKTVGSTTTSSNLQGKIPLALNTSSTSVNLNSSLSLCQSMGVGIQGETVRGLTPTLSVQGGHSSLANTSSQIGSTISTIGGVLGLYGTGNVASGSLSSSQGPTVSTSMAYCVAPNVSVTQGMMVSLPNIQPSQTTVLYQSSLSVSGKDGLAFAGSLRSQLPPSSGILLRSQSVSPLPNGTGPSPPPASKGYVTQYGANIIASCGSYVVGTTKLKPSPSSSPNTVTFTSRQQVGGTAPRVSQLLVQQPNLARVQATGKVGSSSHIISGTSTASLGTNTPIAQFKQMQMQLGQSNAAQRSRTQANSHGQSNVNLSSETRQDILNAGNSNQSSLASRTFQHQGNFLEPLAPTPSEGDAASIL